MDEISELLRPSWGAERWILEGWNQITNEEKEIIKNRLDELFKDGLPFELKHDKSAYIHTFCLLAQLEVLAIQIPLKCQSILTNPVLKQLMRQQLLDEIFHGLVFTKIAYELSAPHALPPAYSDNLEILCNFIRNEDDPQIAIVLLNLISEGWIEEFFICFRDHKIAPNVFETIIADEHRHVCEADLYTSIGLPDPAVIEQKIGFLENQLVSNVLLQHRYTLSVATLIGSEKIAELFHKLDMKHNKQLAKIHLKPSANWQYLMKVAKKVSNLTPEYLEVEISPLRKTLMSQWQNPTDPTMVGQFNINVSCFDYFSNPYPSNYLSLLILQSISLTLYENECLRLFLDGSKLYQIQDSLVGLIVKLPDCGDHLSTIVLTNCHELTIQDLALKIKNIMKVMAYCYKKCEQLEKEHPHLRSLSDDLLQESNDIYYGYPLPGSPIISLTDLSSFGFSQAKSPLRPNERAKYTMLGVERKPQWNHKTQEFEPQDLLAMSISADHRVIDGNVKLPKLISQSFETLFTKMKVELPLSPKKSWLDQRKLVINYIEKLLDKNLDLNYKFLSLLYTMWLDDSIKPELFLTSSTAKGMFKQPQIVF
ncbi:MAG: 2-oxo acid dehydrogenase subunit E2 [Tatlockia sp.]|nr:2-oxo acid dehydrogenase subunit E2 [Tatlockia sp.]